MGPNSKAWLPYPGVSHQLSELQGYHASRSLCLNLREKVMTNPAGAQHPTLVYQPRMEHCHRNASSEDRSGPYKCDMCSGQEDRAGTTEIVSHSKCRGKAMFGRLDALELFSSDDLGLEHLS